MYNSGAGTGRLDGAVGNFGRGDRHLVRLAGGVARAGDGAGDEDVAIHGERHGGLSSSRPDGVCVNRDAWCGIRDHIFANSSALQPL